MVVVVSPITWHSRHHAAAVLREEEIETVELVDSHGRLKGP